MTTFTKIFSILCIALLLPACRVDLTVNGDGEGVVQTETGSINCSTGSTGDCVQSYVIDVAECPGYVPPLIPNDPQTIPDDCTVIVADYAICTAMTNEDTTNCVYDTGVLEIFHALAGEGSGFTHWGGDDIACNGEVSSECGAWISGENASGGAEVAIEANFAEDTSPEDASYTYNHLGQRKSKTVNGTTTYFVYSDIDGQMLGEYNDEGSPIRQYLYAEGERVGMYQYDNSVSPATKQIIYFANNHIGQTVIAWNADGDPVYQRVQTPFGETKGEYGLNGIKVPTRFPGQYYDSESGFNDNGYRAYDSAIGGYLQPDRIGVLKDFRHDPELQVAVEQLQINTQSDDMGLNQPYTYVSSNPVTYVDPYGLFGQTVPGKPGGGHGPMGGMGRPLGDMFSDPNGNMWGQPGPQDWRCTLPHYFPTPGGFINIGGMADFFVPERCKKHDQCYEDNKCTASSWCSSALGGTKSCNQCNSGFFE